MTPQSSSDLSVDDLRQRGLVTAAEAAAQLRVDPSTVRQWARRYGLRRVRVAGVTYLMLQDVMECDRDRRRETRGRRRGAATDPGVFMSH